MNGGRFRIHLTLITLLLSIVVVPSAYAQSAIAGVVRDSSGAVLPGVSVEASSAALIEGVRTAVTDNAGSYKIENLRPGVYAVTFTLTGFRSVKRDEISLPTSFTATINAEMSVGALQESVTVSGESPLVDVRGSGGQSVMSRERLDTIPTGKDPFAVGQLIAGVTASTPDVGGTQVMQQPTLQVHGSSNNDNVFMVDGVQIQHIGFGGNQTGFYFNDGLMEEINYQTSSLTAEAPVGGVQINMIPRDGGNTYRGTVFVTGANGDMQADNLSQDLVDLGFKIQNQVQSVYDANFTFGGPVKRDRLWFFATYRRWSANNFLGNTFTSTGAQAVDDQHISDYTVRLTLQANRNNKFSFHFDRSVKWRGHRPNNWLTASINDPISDVVQTTQLNYIGEIKWSSTDRQPAARRSGDVHDAGQLHPRLRARRRPRCDRDLRSDQVGDQRRVAAHGHEQRADVHLRRQRLVHHRRAQPQGRRAGADRLVAGAVHHARRHPADHEQRRGQLRAPGEHAERSQGRWRELGALRPGFMAAGALDAEPGPAIRAVRHVDPGAGRGGRHVGAGSRLRRAGRHRELEHGLAAARLLVGCVRRRQDGVEGRRQPLRSSRGRDHHSAAQPAEHLVPNLPVERHQRRQECAEQRDRVRQLQRLAAAGPRQRRSGTEAAASVGIHRDAAAPDWQRHVGEHRLLRAALR